MSGKLDITFATDMPSAVVEVVAPDLHVVERMMMSPGRTKSVEVPSEASFLRVYLPSGSIATLEDPGNLNRVVSLQSLRAQDTRNRTPSTTAPSTDATAAPAESAPPNADTSSGGDDLPNRSAISSYYVRQNQMVQSAPPVVSDGEHLSLGQYGTVRLARKNGDAIPGSARAGGREAQWEIAGAETEAPLTFGLERLNGTALAVSIPGNVRRVWARADYARGEGALTFTVRVMSSEPTADTVLGYLQRGDLYSASSMSEWIDEAEEMLLYKKVDPYAAAVGAYLLLRLRQFDRMRDWPRNLADRFDFLPDGCVIWAWQLIGQDPKRESEIADYLLRAASRGLPVYTEGLRLLFDGLQLLGDTGRTARQQLMASAGATLRDSPLTAIVRARESYSRGSESEPVVFDIAFGGEA